MRCKIKIEELLPFVGDPPFSERIARIFKLLEEMRGFFILK